MLATDTLFFKYITFGTIFYYSYRSHAYPHDLRGLEFTSSSNQQMVEQFTNYLSEPRSQIFTLGSNPFTLFFSFQCMPQGHFPFVSPISKIGKGLIPHLPNPSPYEDRFYSFEYIRIYLSYYLKITPIVVPKISGSYQVILCHYVDKEMRLRIMSLVAKITIWNIGKLSSMLWNKKHLKCRNIQIPRTRWE